jgi:ABC-type spermidine/putrescine transport system permease subunit I
MDWRRRPGRPAARWARIGGVALLGAGAAGAIAIVLLPLAARALVRGIVLLASACVWLATSLSMGVSVWTIFGTIWRNVADALATPLASALLWSLVVLGALAFYWLQRLLGSEEE